MKTSKKIIIPFFSTIVGLSLAAGIGGAFAWYQYNSQATLSFVGSSVADTGVLQIGRYVDHDNDPSTGEILKWGRDVYDTGEAAKLVPVTFGEMGANNALPAKAYAYPEAGCGEGYSKWVEAKAGKQYAQFSVYLRALVPDAAAPGDAANGIAEGYKLAARNVFLSRTICEVLTANKVADEALRIHLAVENQGNFLFSKNEILSSSPLALSGKLDLDQNNHLDTYHKTAFDDLTQYGTWDDDGDPETPAVYHQDGEEIVYGVRGQTQTTKALSDMVVARDADGKMPISTDTDFAKKILTTSASSNVKVTVTIWLEGWEYLKTGVNQTTSEVEKSQVWNPKYAAGTNVQVGLEFDSGIFRGEDLNQ